MCPFIRWVNWGSESSYKLRSLDCHLPFLSLRPWLCTERLPLTQIMKTTDKPTPVPSGLRPLSHFSLRWHQQPGHKNLDVNFYVKHTLQNPYCQERGLDLPTKKTLSPGSLINISEAWHTFLKLRGGTLTDHDGCETLSFPRSTHPLGSLGFIPVFWDI